MSTNRDPIERTATDAAHAEEQPRAVRVAVADDGYVLSEAVSRLESSGAGVQLVATCADEEECLAAVTTLRPAVVVTAGSGIALAERLRDTHAEVGVVVVGRDAHLDQVLSLVDRGAEGRAYLLMSRLADMRHLLEGLHAVANAGTMIDSEVVGALLPHAPAELAAREVEILGRVAQGQSDSAIAEAMFARRHATARAVETLFAKLGLTGAGEVPVRVKAALDYLVSCATRGATGPAPPR